MTSSDWTTISDSPENCRLEVASEAKRALAYLQTHRNYRYIEFLAQGGFGWVGLVYDDDNARLLAVKCSNVTSEMELSWWPRLKHRNILPLLEHIRLETCSVFIMPAMRKDLWSVIKEDKFQKDSLSFDLCRVWLNDVANALSYLHSKFLCHQDLKPDNVFIKNNGFACLGDFSLLSDTRKQFKGYVFLGVHEPEEVKEFMSQLKKGIVCNKSLLGGDKYDLWLYGILCIDLLSNMTVSKMIYENEIWEFLEKILQEEDYLSHVLVSNFKNVVFKREDFASCQDFIRKVVNLEPNERMSAKDAINHAFINVKWPQLRCSLPELAKESLSSGMKLLNIKTESSMEKEKVGSSKEGRSEVSVEKDGKSDDEQIMMKKITTGIKQPFYKQRKMNFTGGKKTKTPKNETKPPDSK